MFCYRCPICLPDQNIELAEETIDLLSKKKWHPRIIYHLLNNGHSRFRQLKDSLEGVSNKALSESLEELQQKDLIKKEVENSATYYELTEEGKNIEKVLDKLQEWGEKFRDEEGPTVLIIEDENNQAELYERWLSLGYNALVANTRTESYEKLSEDVDVILLDRHLEKNSAKDVLEGNEILAEKTVIILIGVEPDEDVLEMNINGYIMKPVDRGEIKEAVEKGLATKEKNEKVQRLISLLTRKAAIKQKKTKTDP